MKWKHSKDEILKRYLTLSIQSCGNDFLHFNLLKDFTTLTASKLFDYTNDKNDYNESGIWSIL